MSSLLHNDPSSDVTISGGESEGGGALGGGDSFDGRSGVGGLIVRVGVAQLPFAWLNTESDVGVVTWVGLMGGVEK